MYTIGLTGCIASGKSTICNYLNKQKDISVIKVDEIAKDLFLPNNETYDQILAEFRDYDILSSSGTIDRAKLGSIAFSDNLLLSRLNGVAFPFLLRRLKKQLSQVGTGIVVVEAGILFQANWDDLFDEIWVTDVSDDIAVQRVMERDGYDAQSAQMRVNLQLPKEEQRRRANKVIKTNGTMESTEEQILREIKSIRDLNLKQR